jgi:organic radical activating enzyme
MISYENPNKINWFLVSWTLSNKCNYRCSYCPEHLHNGTTGQPEWTTVERFIKNFTRPGKEICYRLSGGEPTHWKHFIDMAKLVKECGHTFSFMTNGSQSVDYYKEIDNYIDGMIISYHPEYADTKHIIEVANSMSCPVALNLMMVQDQFDSLLAIAKDIFDNTDKLAIWPKVVLDKSNPDHITNKPAEYTDSQLDMLQNWPYFRKIDDIKLHRGNILLDGEKTDANKLILNDLNRHMNWQCYGGLDMINIDMWGNMYRSDCKNGGPLGNIERYGLPIIPIRCEMDSCNCLSDIYLRKQRC